jgi:hypothetical protein
MPMGLQLFLGSVLAFVVVATGIFSYMQVGTLLTTCFDVLLHLSSS